MESVRIGVDVCVVKVKGGDALHIHGDVIIHPIAGSVFDVNGYLLHELRENRDEGGEGKEKREEEVVGSWHNCLRVSASTTASPISITCVGASCASQMESEAPSHDAYVIHLIPSLKHKDGELEQHICSALDRAQLLITSDGDKEFGYLLLFSEPQPVALAFALNNVFSNAFDSLTVDAIKEKDKLGHTLYDISNEELNKCWEAIDEGRLLPGVVVRNMGTVAHPLFRDTLVKFSPVGDSSTPPRIVFVGAKGAGKSTALRHSINHLLSTHKEVILLDCDIGQTEAFVPATITLFSIKEPLFSSPFTHLREPLLSYFLGSVSPTSCVMEYKKCVEFSFTYYERHFHSCPLVVNTMGWVKALGHMLLGEVINTCRPTNIIEFAFDHPPKNVEQPLEEGLPLLRTPSHDWRDGRANAHTGPLSCNIVHIQAAVDFIHASLERESVEHPSSIKPSLSSTAPTSYGKGIHPATLRDMAIASYFLSNGECASYDKLFLEQPTYSIAFSQVCIMATASIAPERVLYALNGSIVALSQEQPSAKQTIITTVGGIDVVVSSSSEPLPIIGFGIVRSIDTERQGCLFIITPVSQRELSAVQTIIKGDLNVPSQLMLHQGDIGTSRQPYVSRSYSDPSVFGRGARKTRNNLGRNRN
eukprot:m.103353 g.103353  ORF g.103353 m.103353 type:complete len:646 (-) comp9092_c0_seq4:133-2070(-)